MLQVPTDALPGCLNYPNHLESRKPRSISGSASAGRFGDTGQMAHFQLPLESANMQVARAAANLVRTDAGPNGGEAAATFDDKRAGCRYRDRDLLCPSAFAL